MERSLSVLLPACLAAVAPAAIAQSATETVFVDIPASSLDEALLELSRQTRVAIVFTSQDVRGRRSPALKGRVDVDRAIRRLIGSAPLDIRRIGERGIALTRTTSPETPLEVRPPDASEVVVVVGNLLTRTEAIGSKYQAVEISDVLGEDELGQLIDRGAAESFDRLPGVSMLVEKGEGRYVQIRGLASNLNGVTLNGVPFGSPEAELGGRQTPLDIFSAGILSGVEVQKTRTPDQSAQGLGGVLNVKTKGPFDRPENMRGDFTARVGFEDLQPKDNAYGGHAPYALSGNFGGKTPDGTMGWIVGGAFSSQEYVLQGVYQDGWSDKGEAILPEDVKNNYYVIGRERVNLNAEVEFRPNETDTVLLRGLHLEWNEFQHRIRRHQKIPEGVTASDPFEGVAPAGRALQALRLEHARKSVDWIEARASREREDLTLDLLVQANRTHLFEPHDNWEFRSEDDAFGPNAWSLNADGIVTLTPTPGAAAETDADLLLFDRFQRFDRRMKAETAYVEANVEWRPSNTLSLKTGLSAQWLDRWLDQAQSHYLPGETAFSLGASDSFVDGAFYNRTPLGGGPNFWMNVDALNAWFDDPTNADGFLLDEDAVRRSQYGNDYTINERVFSTYGMATLRRGDWELLAGVRAEAAHVDTGAYALSPDVLAPRKDDASYVDWLPAVIVNYRPSPEAVLRASVTTSLGRPPFDDIAAFVRFQPDDEEPTGVLRVGDVELRPRRATSIDVSAEWYPDPWTVLSVAGFYKEIDREAYTMVREAEGADAILAELAAVGLGGTDIGEVETLSVRTLADDGASYLQGVEIHLQTQLADLPAPLDGLGVAASLAFLDGHTDLPSGKRPLLGQPDETFAAVLFYQKGPLDASLSYSYNASYLTDYADDPDERLDQGAFGRWDARASWSVNSRLKLFVEGVNLNNEPTTEFQGGRERWNTEYEYAGRTVFVGASYGF